MEVKWVDVRYWGWDYKKKVKHPRVNRGVGRGNKRGSSF